MDVFLSPCLCKEILFGKVVILKLYYWWLFSPFWRDEALVLALCCCVSHLSQVTRLGSDMF